MADEAIETEASTFRLIYRSRNRIPAADRKLTLGDLFSEARSKNKSKGITGALMVSDDWFVQTLEGPEDGVRRLYERIEQDPRHDSFSLLEAKPEPGRLFARWSMAEISPDPDGVDTFLLAHRDGISPAASLRPTPGQEAVLQVMRVAARGGSYQPKATEEVDRVPRPKSQQNGRLRPRSM